MNTLNKINTVDDLINLLYSNNIFFEFYKKYTKQAFLQLLKKESFKKSFNEMFIIFITTNDISGIKSFLKLYPIGTLLTDNELNKIQIYTYKNINENVNELLIEKYPLQIQSGSGIGSKIGNVLLKAYNSEAGKQLSKQLIKESSNVASNAITKASTKINEKIQSGSGIGSKIGSVLLKVYNSEAGKQLSEQLIKESSNVASNVITKTSNKINEKIASK